MTLDTGRPPTIPLKSKVKHKFYEPLVLLKSLNEALTETASQASSTEKIDLEDEREVFKTFTYKLAHICDNVKADGGQTVSSCAVLRNSEPNGGIMYLFASNGRDDTDLNHLAGYIVRLLQMVKQSGDEPPAPEVFHSILIFNRPRITHYVKQLDKYNSLCLEQCSDDPSDESQSIAAELRQLQNALGNSFSLVMEEVRFIQLSKKIVRQLKSLEDSDVGELILERAREGRTKGMRSQDCWSELRHAISRILAYFESFKFFLLARNKWPELFENFTVSTISSSEPMERPQRGSSMQAENIVGRMTRKPKEIEIFRNFVSKLQHFDLDERIKQQYSNQNFRPVVHSEILLLDWLEKNGGLGAERFFNGWKYIGSSKPTCRLCHYYFVEHRSGVEYRATHGNLYLNWRVPDVLQTQGEKGEEDRQIMVDRILLRVRKDAFELVRKKAQPQYRVHDSNTSSAGITLDGAWTLGETGTNIEDDLVSLVGQMGLNDDKGVLV